jgi:hypothetical protein
MSEQLPADADDRPWEQPGATRRDWEPHRGRLVKGLGTVSLLCGLGAASLFCSPLAGLGVARLPSVGIVAGLAAVGLGAAAVVMGRSDLRAMRVNLVDPGGRLRTRAGLFFGLVGATVGGFALLVGLRFLAAHVVVVP